MNIKQINAVTGFSLSVWKQWAIVVKQYIQLSPEIISKTYGFTPGGSHWEDSGMNLKMWTITTHKMPDK